jgi:hypothetical protein
MNNKKIYTKSICTCRKDKIFVTPQVRPGLYLWAEGEAQPQEKKQKANAGSDLRYFTEISPTPTKE